MTGFRRALSAASAVVMALFLYVGAGAKAPNDTTARTEGLPAWDKAIQEAIEKETDSTILNADLQAILKINGYLRSIKSGNLKPAEMAKIGEELRKHVGSLQSPEISKVYRGMLADAIKSPPEPEPKEEPKKEEPKEEPKTDNTTTAGGGGLTREDKSRIAWELRKIAGEHVREVAPDDGTGWSASGSDDMLEGDYGGAFKSFDRALALGDKSAKTYAAYGTAAYHLGDYGLAVRSADLALRADPNNRAAFALKKLAMGRAPTVKLPSALMGGDAFDGGVPETAGYVGGETGLESIAAGVSPVPPSRLPPPVSKSARERSAGLTKEAAAALAVHDYPRAVETAGMAVKINPNNAKAWNYRAIAHNKLTRFKDAVYDASYALRVVPKNTPALQSRAWALNKMGQYGTALADADAVLERDPGNAFALQNRAFAQAGLGDRAGMLESLKRSAELDRRFQDRYVKALQAPDDSDVLFLFDDAPAAEAEPAAPRSKKRFGMIMLSVAAGGLLAALGLLHVVSASWREKVRTTMRRALGSPVSAGSAAEPESGPESGTIWTKYRFVRELGMGGMGVVYEGLDTALDRPVAVKKMRDEIRLDRRERERFLQEARLVASMRHPNIVEIYSIVEDGGEVYLVFEFARGQNLSEVLDAKGAVPFDEAVRILKDASEAVDYAHRHKVIHRDIKPSNIMVTDDGVKVMDFGVARQAKDAATKTQTNTVVGTPPYMAPEAEQGTVRRESDVYALGVLFYEMLSSRLPFAGMGAGMLLNKLNGKFAPLSQTAKVVLPHGLDDVMSKVLSPDPDKRYRSAAEFCSAVAALRA